MLSLANTRRRLSAWFHKPLDTMLFNPWSAIIDCYLFQPISYVLFYFVTAASASPTPELVLDRLDIVWIWLNKHPDPPEHEYIIIETKDSQTGETRFFIIDCLVQKPDPASEQSTTTKNNAKHPDNSGYQLLGDFQGLSSFIQSSILSSCSISPLSSMEEGTPTSTSASASASTSTSTSTLYPPVLFLMPQHSIGNTLSLSATKTSQAISDSLEKGSKMDAFNRILGDGAILHHQYGFRQNAQQIKPNNLKLFEFLLVAKVVHDFAPFYSHLKKNCYWFCNIIIDAIIKIFGLDNSIDPADNVRTAQYSLINPHQSEISGRWKGWKVSHTKPEDLSMIIRDFKKAHTDVISQVKVFFS